MKVIVFDAMGVLYRYGDVQGRVLIPYLRAEGCAAPEEEIRAAYRSVTLGRMTTDEFWPALGLTPVSGPCRSWSPPSAPARAGGRPGRPGRRG
ncbi:hypothetical protein [Nonomuraea sp. JJY05]|uniref:hypothetical protein n=1 Tax=Nonomuraea sp. JJY05 TaxID=3350255 RepID=UPI00373E44F9